MSRVGKREGPGFISPDVQREAIAGWAAQHGVDLVEIFEELDESGAQADRPLLERAISRIEAGASAGLVVWRVDRFGRSLADGVRVIERIRNVGGGFYSVQDGLDTNTDAGRLVLRILLSVAEYQLDGVRASWDASRERAIRRGVFIGPPIVGYRRTRSGRLRPNPKTAPVIAEVFRRRAQGESLNSLCRCLELEGVRTGNGNRGWAASSLAGLIRSRAYLGEVSSGRHVKEGAHVPLTDPATWQAAQTPLELRHQASGKPAALLVGVARCAGCAHCLNPFIAHGPGKPPCLSYRCRRFHAGGACPAPATITALRLESYVTEVMYELLEKRRGAPNARLAQAEALAVSAAEALVRYRDNDRIGKAIGAEAFARGLRVRSDRVVDANLAVADARARLGVHALPAVAEVRRTFPEMPLAERRRFVRRVIDVVFVTTAHGPATHRVIVCPAGTAPRPLPRRGDRGRLVRTITPRRGWVNPITPTIDRTALDDEPWVTALVVAEHFHVARHTVDGWRQKGMPSAKFGWQRRFRLSECLDWYHDRWPAHGG